MRGDGAWGILPRPSAPATFMDKADGCLSAAVPFPQWVAGDGRSLALACPLGLARVAFEQESEIPLFIAVKTRLGGVPGKFTGRLQKVEKLRVKSKVIIVTPCFIVVKP